MVARYEPNILHRTANRFAQVLEPVDRDLVFLPFARECNVSRNDDCVDRLIRGELGRIPHEFGAQVRIEVVRP